MHRRTDAVAGEVVLGEPDGVVAGAVHHVDALEGALVDGLERDPPLGPAEELEHRDLHGAGSAPAGAREPRSTSFSSAPARRRVSASGCEDAAFASASRAPGVATMPSPRIAADRTRGSGEPRSFASGATAASLPGDPIATAAAATRKIGRASCRERVEVSGGASGWTKE